MSAALTAEVITASTGEERLERLEEVEIIFTTVNELSAAAFQRCSQLRSLTLIDTGLRRISGSALAPLGSTLLRLCLCEHGLRKMEGLTALPQLRELFLHQNAISRIEGLEGCPRLQRLWLFGNRLESLEGLHPCNALRELLAQENSISSLSGFPTAALPNLRSLALAGNPIGGDAAADSAALRCLGQLPSLLELSMDDAHFGSCPIVTSNGGSSDGSRSGSGGRGGCGSATYRAAAVAALPLLRRLDGVEVDGNERARAAEQKADEDLRFQAALDEISRERERITRNAELWKRRAGGRASSLQKDMTVALAALEKAVTEGRAAVTAAATARAAAEQLSLAALEADISAEKVALAREVASHVAAEKARAAEELRLMRLLEDRAALEKRHFDVMSALQAGNGNDGGYSGRYSGGFGDRSGDGGSYNGVFETVNGRSSGLQAAGNGGGGGGGNRNGAAVACHELAEHLPELQHLQDLMRLRQCGPPPPPPPQPSVTAATAAATVVTDEPSLAPPFRLLRACRIYGARICEAAAPFWTAGASRAAGAAAAAAAAAGDGSSRGGSAAASSSAAASATPGAAASDEALFLCLPMEETIAVCRGGLAALAAFGQRGAVALFSDPRAAVAASATAAAPGSSGNQNGSGYKGDRNNYSGAAAAAAAAAATTSTLTAELPPPEAAMLLVVRVAGKFAGSGGGSGDGSSGSSGGGSGGTSAARLRSLVAELGDAAEPVMVDCGGGGGAGGSSGGYVLILPPRHFARALPEYHLLCARGAVAADPRKIEAALAAVAHHDGIAGGGEGGQSSVPERLLSAARERLAQHVRRHAERVAAGASPEAAERLARADFEVSRRREEVAELRRRVEGERRQQAELLLSAR